MGVETIESIQIFEKYAERLPLELFVFAGSFLEEAISPIPSFVVLVPAGVAAQVQGYAWWYILVLALFSAAGRIIAACLLYMIADKSENWIFNKGRRFLGVTHADVTALGKRMHRGWRDWWTLFLLNAIPIVPTSFLSLACGFIKIPFVTFLTATLVGTIVNSVAYLSIGYAGLEILTKFSGFDLAFQIVGGLMLVALIIWWLARKRQKHRSP